jgi:hypothetical protein
LCKYLNFWATVRGVHLGDIRAQEALLREAHGLLRALEGTGRLTEDHVSELSNVEFSLGRCLWTAGRGAEGEPLLRNVMRRQATDRITRLQAREFLADTALQRGELGEAARLCDEALAVTGETPEAFPLFAAAPTEVLPVWMEIRVQMLSLRGSVEECRGDLVGAWRYDDRVREVLQRYGAAVPVDTLRRNVPRVLRLKGGRTLAAAEIAAIKRGYVRQFGERGPNLLDRRKLEMWVRALRESASLLRSGGGLIGDKSWKEAEAMEGEATEIEGVFDALKAAAVAEARAAVAQERASRQQRRAAEEALLQLPAPPPKLTKSQKKKARQKAARAAFVAGGGAEGDQATEAAAAAAASTSATAVDEGQEEEGGQDEGDGQAIPPPAPDLPPVDAAAPVEECSLCLEAMATGDTEEAEAVVVGCGHQFHGMCMDMWTATCAAKGLPYTCPLCRHFLQPPGIRPANT